jgi:hypothetical protein
MNTNDLLPNPTRRDWKRILHGLARAGISTAEVAAKCNRNPTTVTNWAKGIDPKDTDARIILALYAKHLPEDFLKQEAEFGVRSVASSSPDPQAPEP